ncbi:MAG: acetolactate synthase small subunit [bacterium]|nr:acetolactate synthase small subunit [bacterium]
MRHTISLLVRNKPGVLSHIAGLFSARGYNIDSLTVGETDDNTVSRMTIVTIGDDRIVEQVSKQLNKLIDVIKVVDLTDQPFVDRELVLIKVQAEGEKRSQIIEITDIFRAKIVDVSPKTITVEITGDDSKIQAIIELLSPFGIKEIARTGKVAIARGREAGKNKGGATC